MILDFKYSATYMKQGEPMLTPADIKNEIPKWHRQNLDLFGLLPFCLSKKVTEKGHGNRNARVRTAHPQAEDFGPKESSYRKAFGTWPKSKRTGSATHPHRHRFPGLG